MPFADPQADPSTMDDFLALAGRKAWQQRMADLGRVASSKSLGAKAASRRHALELTLAKLCDRSAWAKASLAERRLLAFACEAVRLAGSLPKPSRERLRALIAAGLSGEANLIPLFHLVRVAALMRARGFEVRHDGLVEGTPHDLAISRDGVTAEVACLTVSAEEGRHVHRHDWCALVDRVNPDLQTWLAAHPGRYLLKMTLPDGIQGEAQVADLHRRITTLLSEERRQDADGSAVLKLDPLLMAGVAAAGDGLPAGLRAQFGPEAHLAVAGGADGGSVFVLAARAGRENDIAAAVTRRLSEAARTRVSGRHPAILATFLDEVDRAEWRGLRDRLELEGAARRFLTTPEARPVAAVSCASRMELLGASPPDAAPHGELRFRNPSHAGSKHPALAPAVASLV